MPPQRRDPDSAKSEVHAHIMSVLKCDLAKAEKVFNFLRQKRRGIIVYDGRAKVWIGERSVNPLVELRHVSARLEMLEQQFDDLRARLNRERLARIDRGED